MMLRGPSPSRGLAVSPFRAYRFQPRTTEMIHKSLSRVGIALLVLTSAGFAQNYFTEPFNNNSAGWTLGPEWAIGPATPSSGQVYNGPDPAYDAYGVTGGGLGGLVIGGHGQT